MKIISCGFSNFNVMLCRSGLVNFQRHNVHVQCKYNIKEYAKDNTVVLYTCVKHIIRTNNVI